MAFAYSDDLSGLVFSTPRATRKYRLLSQCRNVALLVDSRSRDPEHLMTIDAVTATGEATELSPGEAQRVWSERLVTRHPHLRDFIEAPSSAMFRIEVTRFYYVRRFQDASQWSPPFTER